MSTPERKDISDLAGIMAAAPWCERNRKHKFRDKYVKEDLEMYDLEGSFEFDNEALLSYRSPIDIITHAIDTKIENEILTAIQKIGVNVDKDELIKALAYDRGQYQKGYNDRDSEIIRCKDCQHRPIANDVDLEFPDYVCPCQCSGDRYYSWYPEDDWFCPRGERH